MQKILLLLIVASMLSCEKKISIAGSASSQDSISLYFKQSKDSQFSLEERLKSAKKSYKLAVNRSSDTTLSKLLYQTNWLYYSLGQYDSLIKYNQTLLQKAEQINDSKRSAKQHYLMGYYYKNVASIPDSAYANFNKSRNYFQQLKDSTWVGNNLLNMAQIQQNQNDYFGSKETVTEAISYLNPTDSSSISSAFDVLATNHRKLQNYSDAITYYKKAIATSPKLKEQNIYKNNLAATYIDQKQYGKAIDLLQNLLKDTTIQTSAQYARVLDNFAYARWLAKKSIPAETFQKPLQLRKKNNDFRGQIASYTHLGEYYSASVPQRAQVYYDSVITLSKRLGVPAAERDVLKKQMQLQAQNIALRNRYIKLQDSLSRATTAVKTQFAKYKYDDRLKQESILRLQKEKAEQELIAAREHYYAVLSFAGFGIALLVAGLLYFTFRQRTRRLKAQNRADRLEAVYNTETSLSRRLHDQFGAGLNHLMLLLQRKTPVTQLLDIVEGLYQQSRDLSREINEVDTSAGFEKQLRNMLASFTPPGTRLINGSKAIDWARINESTKITIFRVLRELMINMRKHSHAQLVNIQYHKDSKNIKIKYADNGHGASQAELYNKNGLQNTEKRTQAMGGSITFDSRKGAGFKAIIILPDPS